MVEAGQQACECERCRLFAQRWQHGGEFVGLLCSYLTPEQRLGLVHDDAVTVTGSLGRKYMLYTGGSVRRLREDGDVLCHYCVGPRQRTPYPAKRILILMAWIQADEAAFLNEANEM